MEKIELKQVYFIYSKDTPYEVKALNGINIEILPNTVTGIIGHTGSGKSTLVQLLNGLLKPTSGHVLLDGQDINEKDYNIRQARFRVGLVMQYPEYQLFDDTVRLDIAYGPKNMKLDKEEIDKCIEYAAKFTGLDAKMLDKSPFELSGGQKRRAALAGVIAMKPELLVLDEPAAGLDPRSRREILSRIREYKNETGSAVIIVSHSMEDMAKYCDRVIVMQRGKIMLDGTPAEVFANSGELISIGLDVPQITGIASELRENGFDIGDDIYTVNFALRRIAEKFGIDEETIIKAQHHLD